VGDRVVGDGLWHIYTVARVDGDWLWVTWQNIEGWLPVNQVVPFDQAIDFYSQEIRANPGRSAAWWGRGIIWREKNEIDLAIADLSEAIRLKPSASAYNLRSSLRKAKREFDKAIADANEAIRIDPGFALAYNYRGIAWRERKEYDKAIADYSEAIRLKPSWEVAFCNRGNAWLDKKEYDKAIADSNEAIRLDPKFGRAFGVRGDAWSAKKEYDKAIADYNEAIRLDPEPAMSFNNRGNVWRLKKDFDKAIADFNESIRLDPKLRLAFSNRAWIWATCPDAKLRNGRTAVESATRSCELTKWKEANCMGTLAAAYAEAGDFAKAVEYQEKANKLYTDAQDREKGEERLRLYKHKKPYRDKG
jgi:tetratricopeptide (TPR) repeat protein